MFRRLAVVVVVLGMVCTTLLAACAVPAPQVIKEVPVTVEVTVEVPVEAPAERVKLNVWSSPDNADALLELAQQFMEANPNIQIEVTPTSWEVLYPQILADINAGTGAFDVATWDLMTAGSIAPGFVDLTKYAEAYPDLVDPEFDKDDFIPQAWHVYGMWGDKNIGYPFYGAAMLFFYRKDLFEDPGLQAKFNEKYGAELKVPATWDEAIPIAEFFTREFNPDSPTEYGIGLMFPRTHSSFYEFLNWFGPLRRGPEAVAEMGDVDLDYGDYFTADGKPAFDSPQGVKAMEQIRTLMQYSSDPLGSDYGETLESFGRGLVAMVPQWSAVLGSWAVAPELQPLDEKVGIAVMPGGAPVSGGWGLGINASSQHKHEAFRFVQFATSKQADKLQWLKYRLGPTRVSTTQDPEVLADSPWIEDVYLTSLDQSSQRPRIPQQPKLEDVTVGWITDMLAGQKGDDDAASLAGLAEEWNKILGQ